MDLKVEITPGGLPTFWDREVIFFANIHSLFFDNVGLAKVLEREIRGVPTYGGRLIPILCLLFRKGKNLLYLEAQPEESLLEYISSELGLALPQIEILPHQEYAALRERLEKKKLNKSEPLVDKVCGHRAEWMDGYATDPALAGLADLGNKSTISSVEGSKRGNNKYLLYLHLLDKGLPVFDTLAASTPGDIASCQRKLSNQGYKKIIFKSQIGASGCGMVKQDAGEKKTSFPEYLFFEGPCLVQGWLDEGIPGVRRLGSPSVQMFLNGHELSLFDVTEQFLKEDCVHEGNISPPPYLADRPYIRDELYSQATEAGRWLHAQGYRGTASVDFLVVERDGETVVMICEINARITGATYPSVLARNFLPNGAWLMRNLRFHPPLPGRWLLSELDRTSLLFTPKRGKGVLPCNFNVDASGTVHKGQFVFLASGPEECLNLLARMRNVFPRICQFDRD